MKDFNRGKLFLIKFSQVLLSILFLLFLVFIIKWRIDSLYLNSISNSKIKIGIADEFKKTTNEILVATGLKAEENIKPIVILDEEEEKEEEKNKQSINKNNNTWWHKYWGPWQNFNGTRPNKRYICLQGLGRWYANWK